MGLSGLNNIRRRMKSVGSIQKITRAMSLVATSKLRRVKIKLEGNKGYREYIEDIMKDILISMESDNYYTMKKESGRDLYLVVTSNMGLSGAYNINVFNEVMKNIKNNEKNSMIIVVGEKGKTIFKRRNIKSEAIFWDVNDEPNIEEVNNMSKLVIDMYTKDDIKNVYLVYTEFISSGKQAVKTEKLFPIGKPKDITVNKYMEMELSHEEMFNNGLSFYVKEKLLYILLSSKTSEQALRMTTMDGATKSAKDILDNLKREYNRIRQASITEEISEIIGGAEAQR